MTGPTMREGQQVRVILPTVREGQRVRVVLEGEVVGVSRDTLTIGREYATRVVPAAAHVMSVVVLPDPEPTEWGAARITSDGRLWLRIATRADTPWVHYREDTEAAVDWSAWDDLDDPRPAVRARAES